VADEFERLFKENIDLSEKLEAASEKLRGYQDMERTLHNTMLAAQQSAEGIVLKANHEAELVLRDAELKAKELVHAALAEKQKAQGEFARIQAAEGDFRARFRGLLEEHIRNIAEIPVSAEAAALASEPVEEYQPVVPHAAVAQVPQAAEPALAPEPEPVAQTAPVAVPVTEEPPASGFVTSVHLGESAAPELGSDAPVFGEAVEFTFGGAGERDEDIDIEEID
jgi:cell division initiation protein